MRLTVFDPELNFECHSCGNCCTRPWRIVVEDEKVEAIREFDWAAKYPQLARVQLVDSDEVTGATQYVLAKAEDGACVFFNRANNRCIIHSELGADAKPHICGKYPYGVSNAPDADRVFVRFSCPSVQAGRGPTLDKQKDAIEKILKPTAGWEGNYVQLTHGHDICVESCGLLCDRLAELFDGKNNGDLWERFAGAIELVNAAGKCEGGQLDRSLRDSGFGRVEGGTVITGYASPRQSPLTPRMLLGITLWNDFFPADSLGRKVGFRKRISMIMKLLQIVQMRSTYASRFLGMNVPLARLGAGALAAPLPQASSDLLRRWIRSRIIARSFAISGLTFTAGTHELVLDFNAVLFLARSRAAGTNAPPTEAMYAEALSIIESRVTAQRRPYRALFPAWTLGALDSPDAARLSLRLFHPDAPVPKEATAAQTATV